MLSDSGVVFRELGAVNDAPRERGFLITWRVGEEWGRRTLREGRPSGVARVPRSLALMI